MYINYTYINLPNLYSSLLSTDHEAKPRDINSWSSYKDFTKKNRWGELLSRDIILDQFYQANGYGNYLRTSSAKLFDNELALE